MESVIDLRDRSDEQSRAGQAGGPPPEPTGVHPSELAPAKSLPHLRMGWRLGASDTAAFLTALGAATYLEGWSPWYALVGVAWAFALKSVGALDLRSLARGSWKPGRIWGAMARVVVALAIIGLVVPSAQLGIVLALLLGLTTWLTRSAFTSWVARRHLNGQLMAPVVARGTREEVTRFLDLLDRDPSQPLHVVAVQLTDGSHDASMNLPHINPDMDPLDAAMREGIPVVAFVGHQPEDSTQMRRLVWRMEKECIDALMVPVVAPLAAPEVESMGTTGMASLSFRGRDLRAETGFSKVVLDKILAAVGLVLIAPLMLVIAVAVKRTSPGPILFRQTRVGRDRELFTMYKFRTMVVDAEQRLAEVAAQNAHEGGTLFKIQNDPRITRVGGFLRRYSLDELPQLLNVLRGDMSLVGPRPPLPREVENYHIDAHRRFCVRPGLTGLWQVSGRSDLDPVESARLDTLYVESWKPVLDLRILASTARVVLTGDGAY